MFIGDLQDFGVSQRKLKVKVASKKKHSRRSMGVHKVAC